MDPSRKRKIRLVVALGAALLLAGALAYTSFSASSEAKTPSQLDGGALFFRVRDRSGNTSVPVRYVGAVPDPFREGREVIVDVRKQGSVFVGERDSLVTKCPSKFKAAHSS